MPQNPLRVGLVGAGANTRTKHIPGLRAVVGVEITAVCNRRPESTAAVARDFDIPRAFDRWQDLVADANIDAVVIGAWPYLHCPVALAALETGKHVLTEARMACNVAEARLMQAASERHPKLVAQIVPSPYGLKGDVVMRELIASGWLGELREVQIYSFNGALADPAAPLSWRQDGVLCGVNMLSLGIIHETLMRWAPKPVRVLAQAHAFIPQRIDPDSGIRRPVERPDSVQVMAVLESGARAVYHFSGVTSFGQGMGIGLYGANGMLHYDLATDRISGASRATGQEMKEIPIAAEKAGGWRVEADFVASIRDGEPVRFTDFPTGVAYMEFTEAVAVSARDGRVLALPLAQSAPV
ncbi:MAG TPA: Gfo/Idh/MocA family oxidoreductase [Gemmataceae bacterium]|nr:Gfo/Idh/MocA family oxidoreductase [Gemmataceae bacterium]